MRTVYLKVNEEYVEGQGTIACAMSSANVPKVNVEFTGWDGLTKHVTLKDANGEHETQVILGIDKLVAENTYEFEIPASVINEQGMVSLAFTGVTVSEGELETVVTSATAYLRVVQSDANIFPDDGSIDATIAQQLQAEIDSFEGIFADDLASSHEYADASKSYAVGDTGTREGEDTDNSKYYSEVGENLRNESETLRDETMILKNDTIDVVSSLPNGFIPIGTVDFDDLPDLEEVETGWVYNIDEDFTTTSDFKRGAGDSVTAGSFVYKTADGYWDYLYGAYPSNYVNIASIFDATASYGVGDYVIYNQQAYRFTASKTAGAWDSTKVTPVYIAGQYVTAGKKANTTLGLKATAEGNDTTASGNYSHAEGNYTTASGNDSHAEGNHTTASDYYSHAEGMSTTASELASHAEGYSTTAGGFASHAEGKDTEATGEEAHAEGYNTTASALYAHAEGVNTTASGGGSHTEGEATTASGGSSHAEGYETTASGDNSHAEGMSTTASYDNSHAEGYGTQTGADYQHVQGKYNIGKSTTLFEIGNGTANDARSNAFEVDTSGNVVAGGSITDGNGINFGNLITVERKTFDRTDLFSGQSVAKTGYTAIGVVGYRCQGVDNSTEKAILSAIAEIRITNNVLYFGWQQVNDSTFYTNLKSVVDVLYLKNS